MDIIMKKGTNWFKGLALFGIMVAVVGSLAFTPAASASRLAISPVPVATKYGKLNVVAADSTNGAAIYAATVVVTNATDDVQVLKGSTDKTGQFTSYISVGTYNVRVIADNYKEYSQVVTITSGQTTTAKAGLQLQSVVTDPPPAIDPEPTTDPVPVPARPIGKLSVAAHNSVDGTVISGAIVAVYNDKGEGVFKGTTDANGNLSAYLGVGLYKVVINATGFQDFGQRVEIIADQTSAIKAGLNANSISPTDL